MAEKVYKTVPGMIACISEYLDMRNIVEYYWSLESLHNQSKVCDFMDFLTLIRAKEA